MAELARLFAEKVRALRAERGLTQPQLADLAGLSDTWVRRIEAGKVSPSLATIEALATALQVEVAELFQDLTPDERLARAIGALDEEAAKWLLAGAHLLRAHRGA